MSAAEGVQQVQQGNGRGRLAPMTSLTLGSANAAPRVGPVMVNEIHYSPEPPTESDLAIHAELTANDLEFIELVNTTTSTIDLAEWRIRGGIELDLTEADRLRGARFIGLGAPENALHPSGELAR